MNKKTLLFIIVCLISTSIFSQGTYVVNRYKQKCGVSLDMWPDNAKWLYKNESGQYFGLTKRPKRKHYHDHFRWKRPRKRLN